MLKANCDRRKRLEGRVSWRLIQHGTHLSYFCFVISKAIEWNRQRLTITILTVAWGARKGLSWSNTLRFERYKQDWMHSHSRSSVKLNCTVYAKPLRRIANSPWLHYFDQPDMLLEKADFFYDFSNQWTRNDYYILLPVLSTHVEVTDLYPEWLPTSGKVKFLSNSFISLLRLLRYEPLGLPLLPQASADENMQSLNVLHWYTPDFTSVQLHRFHVWIKNSEFIASTNLTSLTCNSQFRQTISFVFAPSERSRYCRDEDRVQKPTKEAGIHSPTH